MTRQEAEQHLHWLMFHLADEGYTALAVEVERAYQKLAWDNITPELCKEYASMILPSGRRGRITLVLHQPYESRAIALLVGILRSIE